MKLLTIEQCAADLRVSKVFIHRSIIEGHLKCVQLSPRIRRIRQKTWECFVRENQYSVYVFRVVTGNGEAYKIGISSGLHGTEKRRRGCQTGCPFEISLFHEANVSHIEHRGEIPQGQLALAVERFLHEKLQVERLKGEWFLGSKTSEMTALMKQSPITEFLSRQGFPVWLLEHVGVR